MRELADTVHRAIGLLAESRRAVVRMHLAGYERTRSPNFSDGAKRRRAIFSIADSRIYARFSIRGEFGPGGNS